jgi:hypothetical protein
MNPALRLCFVGLVPLVSACGVHFSTDASKTGAPPPKGFCAITSQLAPTEPLTLNQFLCDGDGHSTLPCACANYSVNNQSVYPNGVFNQNATHQAGQPDMKPIGGCNQSVFDGDIVFAWPDCAPIGEVAGFVQGDPSEVGGGAFEGDDDLSMSVCRRSGNRATS